MDHYPQFLQLVSGDKILERRPAEPVNILDKSNLKLFSFRRFDEFAKSRALAVRQLRTRESAVIINMFFRYEITERFRQTQQILSLLSEGGAMFFLRIG